MPPIFFGSQRSLSCLRIILAVFFCIIFSSGCGSEGSGNEATAIQGGTNATDIGGTNTSYGGQLILESVSESRDRNGIVWILCEFTYRGNVVAYNMSITANFYNADGNELSSNGAIPMTPSAYEVISSGNVHHALHPGEVGIFQVNSRVLPEDLDKYEIYFQFSEGKLGEEIQVAESYLDVSKGQKTKITWEEYNLLHPWAYDDDDEPPDFFPLFAVTVDFEVMGERGLNDPKCYIGWYLNNKLIGFNGGNVFRRDSHLHPFEYYAEGEEYTARYELKQLYTKRIKWVLYPFWRLGRIPGEDDYYRKGSGDSGEKPAAYEAQDDPPNRRSPSWVKYKDRDQWYVTNEYGWEEEFTFPDKSLPEEDQ